MGTNAINPCLWRAMGYQIDEESGVVTRKTSNPKPFDIIVHVVATGWEISSNGIALDFQVQPVPELGGLYLPDGGFRLPLEQVRVSH